MKQNFIIFWRERVVNNSDDFVNNSDDLKKDLIICDFFQKKEKSIDLIAFKYLG